MALLPGCMPAFLARPKNEEMKIALLSTFDLLCEADFYNIEPLVDQIRQAMSPATSRVESIMLFVEYRNKRRFDSIIVCSEEDDDYEVLCTLRAIFSCTGNNGRYVLKEEGQTMTGVKQISFEVILRKFGFVEESYNDNYDESNANKWKCWKFVRTVSK